MATFVAVFALIVAWLALVRSRQVEENNQQLRRNTDRLMQRQQQILQELHPEEFQQQASSEPEVEEIEMTAPAAAAEPSAERA